MYDSLKQTAAKLGATVASNPIGQILLEYTEKCLWAVEKSVQWYMLPEQKPEHKDEDVPSNEAKEPAAAATSSEKSEDTVEPESETVRPLPWVLFFPLLVCLKAAKTSIDVCSYMFRRESVEPASIVEFIQTRRNLLKEIKDQIKSNQEEEKIKDEPLDDSTSSNDNPEVPKIKLLQATPEKEIPAERKTEMETTAAPTSETATPSETESPSETAASSESPSPSETETVLESSDTSPIEETVESDNGNDSSSTLEASLTEKDDTKDEDEDFHSVKSSSTYFSPDSSYSLQSVSDESKAGDNLATELKKDGKELSIAAAIEDLRSLSVTDEAPLPTPTSSLSSSTSSVKLTESTKKKSSFSSFFQVKRKTT